MPKILGTFAVLAAFATSLTSAFAGSGNVAIIDNGAYGPSWCQFLIDHGFACTVFPKEGPTGPLDPFDVVIDTSPVWSDPTGTLRGFILSGKNVVALGVAPFALGIDSDPAVQEWIGANQYAGGSDKLQTTTTDPILGNTPLGTVIVDYSNSVAPAIYDTSGHPNAKVLARLGNGAGAYGILRNDWGGAVSVYMSEFYGVFILNAIEARPPMVPVLGEWGLLILAFGVGIAGAMIIRRRGCSPSGEKPTSYRIAVIVFAACLATTVAAVKADVNSTQEIGHA